jgi:hypothetical protein
MEINSLNIKLYKNLFKSETTHVPIQYVFIVDNQPSSIHIKHDIHLPKHVHSTPRMSEQSFLSLNCFRRAAYKH